MPSREGAGGAFRALVVVCGGVAAYKAAEVVRGLQRQGVEVRCVLTEAAERFVGRATFEGLTRQPVGTDEFSYPDPAMRIPHIDLSGWADVVVVVPATANVMAKMAAGIADDLATSALLATPASTPVVVAPAMNVNMWANPATQRNRATLAASGVRLVEPVSGRLACGYEGTGKLAAVEDVVDEAVLALHEARTPQDLAGVRVLVTAGPTREAIDPVRYIANESSGKMGYAVARAARQRGAEVTLVSGPCALRPPAGVQVVDVVSAKDLYRAATELFEAADVAVLAAAVADYTPAAPADHKLKKARERLGSIELVETADVLRALSAERGRRVVVGFAAETEDVVGNAKEKLRRKGCDLIVANRVGGADSAFGSDTDEVALVSADGVERLPRLEKAQVADALLDRVRRILDGRS